LEKVMMSKLQKINKINSGYRHRLHILSRLSAVGLLALAAAVSAASAAQSNSQPSPSSAPADSTFTVAPSLPEFESGMHLQSPAEPLHKAAEVLRGVASWYGPSFDGHLTANGEVYDMYAMTAATSEFNKTLPLGTKVRVVNSNNGRSVIVRITDRGPLPQGRIIDLSYGAARRLAMVKRGTAYVRLHILRWGRNRYNRQAAIEAADRR
jgi:rare lipoprotein A (peptidoglycan hydrolase)